MAKKYIKRDELLEIINKQALQVADLKDALLAAQNAATDAKHHSVMLSEQLSQLETAYGYAVSDNAELVAEAKALGEDMDCLMAECDALKERLACQTPRQTTSNPAADFRRWARQQAAQFGKTIKVDIRRQVVVVDGTEIKYQPS